MRLDVFIEKISELVNKIKKKVNSKNNKNEVEEIDPILEILMIITDLRENMLNPRKNEELRKKLFKLNKEHILSELGLDTNSILYKFVYLYNFVILKNDEYKKIVVAFPGSETYLQIIDEIYDIDMIQLPIKDGKNNYYVLQMYYNIFKVIEKDLFDNLISIIGLDNSEYQVIFTGHSIGGAISTLSSFYYIKKYNFKAENILITFGQPKVGSEIFAKEFTSIMKNQTYRIARKEDIGSLFPFINGIESIWSLFKSFYLAIKFIIFCEKIATLQLVDAYNSFMNFISNIDDFKEEYSYLWQIKRYEDLIYSHIGGLYMINDNTNLVYQCDDFFNEKREHFICKNHNIKSINNIFDDYKYYRNYLSLEQNIMSACQNKGFKFIKMILPEIKLFRRLELNNKFYIKNDNYYFKIIRKLENIEHMIKPIKIFEEIDLTKNNSEFCLKYESEETIKIDDLILFINPNNNYFFGEICLTQNITWLINNRYENIICYFKNTQNPFAIRLNLKKEITNEKELYIYLKGKILGTLELYDFTKNKILNISSSFRIPYIYGYPLDNSLNFLIPKLEENIYANIIINEYNLNETQNNTSILELYKDNNKITYENSYLILENTSDYYFKFYPGEYELILNFIPLYTNKFIEKKFYIIGEQNTSISYNIESIDNNKSLGLFFAYNEYINIRGYFSNFIKLTQDKDDDDYILNTNNNYFNLVKNNDDFNYLNLEINFESEFISELIIYDIQEFIIINTIDSTYELNKDNNYMFIIEDSLKKIIPNLNPIFSYRLIMI